eukprot:scaffold125706_cov56-Attheya_sp.AAC.4
MDDHRTAQDVEVHQGGDVGTSGVENGRDRDSMLATDDAEADKENAGPPSTRPPPIRMMMTSQEHEWNRRYNLVLVLVLLRSARAKKAKAKAVVHQEEEGEGFAETLLIEQLEDDCRALKKDLEEANELIQDQKKVIRLREDELKEREDTLKERKTYNASLRNEYNTVLLKLEKASTDKEYLKSLKAELKATCSKYEKLINESDERRVKLIESNLQKTTFSDQIKTLKRDNDRMERDRVSETRKADELMNRLECKEKDKERLQAKIEKKNNAIRTMKKDFAIILEKSKEKTMHNKTKMRLTFEQQKADLAKQNSADRVNKQKEAQEHKAKIKEDGKRQMETDRSLRISSSFQHNNRPPPSTGTHGFPMHPSGNYPPYNQMVQQYGAQQQYPPQPQFGQDPNTLFQMMAEHLRASSGAGAPFQSYHPQQSGHGLPLLSPPGCFGSVSGGHPDQQLLGRDGAYTTTHPTGDSSFGSSARHQNEVPVNEVVVQQVEQTSTHVNESDLALQDEEEYDEEGALRELGQFSPTPPSP